MLPPAALPQSSTTTVLARSSRKSARTRPGVTSASVVLTEPVRQQHQHTARNPRDIFVCDEESLFYSQCLETLLVPQCHSNDTVIEFGSGDGSPVVDCLIKSAFKGVIHGYELNPKSAALAAQRAAQCDLDRKYKVHNSCFFKGVQTTGANFLIANPPYIPAPDSNILMSGLHGGVDGANLTRDLISLGFQNAVLLISAYSNPVETLEHARKQGYAVTNFAVKAMPFGYYSSEPKVKNWIAKMKSEGKAFYSGNTYLLAGVLLQKPPATSDYNNIVTLSRREGSDSAGQGSHDSHELVTALTATQPAGSRDLTDELLRVLTAF